MGSKSSDPPPAPDYESLAKLEAGQQKQLLDIQTSNNRPTQLTPWGSASWTNTPTVDQTGYDKALADWTAANTQGTWVPPVTTTTPGEWGREGTEAVTTTIPGYWTGATSDGTERPSLEDFTTTDWTQRITLDPAEQRQLDSQRNIQSNFDNIATGLLGDVYNSMAKPLNLEGLDELDPSFGAVQEVQDAMMSRLAPQRAQMREAELQRLRNQGLSDNTEAYQRALKRMDEGDTDAQMQSLLGATQAYGDIFNRTAQARQQGLSERDLLRQSPMLDLLRLQGKPVANPAMPNFVQAGMANAPNLLGAAQQTYNTNLANYNAEQAQGDSMLSGLFGLGGTILGSPAGSLGGAIGGKLGGLFGL